MATPCFQHDAYRHSCADCRDMNGDEPGPGVVPAIGGGVELFANPAAANAVAQHIADCRGDD